jgi:hypothetical protein
MSGYLPDGCTQDQLDRVIEDDGELDAGDELDEPSDLGRPDADDEVHCDCGHLETAWRVQYWGVNSMCETCSREYSREYLGPGDEASR